MSTSRFSGLAANIAETYRMPIVSPISDKPLADKDGKEAYLDLLSADSDVGRKIMRERSTAATKRAMRGAQSAEADATEQNMALVAALTRGWYLVDLDGNAIEVEFSPQNAAELYADPGMAWLFRQAFTAANEVANFIKRSSIN